MPVQTGNRPEPQGEDILPFGGLVVNGGHSARPGNSFRRLDNFDLTVDGAVKKVNGFAPFVPNPVVGSVVYDSPIVAVRSYAREPGVTAAFLVGISQLGKIYNLETGVQIGDIGFSVGFPSVVIMPGYNANTEDGEGGVIQYVIIASSLGGPLVCFEGTTVREVGLVNPFTENKKAPIWPMRVRHIAFLLATDVGEFGSISSGGETVVDRIDLMPHINILTARRYRFTYWNPDTRWESSPSVVNENCIVGQGGIPVEQTWSIFQIGIQFPALGNENRIRVYISREGSESFFLARFLYNDQGDQVCNEDDGSILVEDFNYAGSTGMLFDGLPRVNFGPGGDPYRLNQDPFDDRDAYGIGPRSGTTAGTASPIPDQILVEFGPEEGENDKPPPVTFIAVYQNRLWAVPVKEPNTSVFSKVGEFFAFSAPNVFQFLSDDADGIVALRQEFASLIVGRNKKLSRITGTDFTDFTVTHLEQGYGFLGRNLHANVDGGLYFLNNEGLYRFAMDAPAHVSVPVKPIFTGMNVQETAVRMMMAVDNTNGVLFIGLRTGMFNNKVEEDIILCYDYSQESPFSLIRGTGLPHPAEGETPFNPLYSLQAVPFNGRERIFLGAGDNKVYEWEEGSGLHDSVLETQRLPMRDTTKRKVFRYLKVTNDPNQFDINTVPLEQFYFSVSVNGKPFGPECQLRMSNFLGVTGKWVIIRIRHRKLFGQYPTDSVPLLYNMRIEWVDIGEETC